jgi:hypothetical protein
MRMSGSTITIAACGILLGFYSIGSKAYEFAHVRPIQVGRPFPVRMQQLDGKHSQLPPHCTRVVITDAFCPGGRSAAHEWREIPGANAVWLVLNPSQQAREYRSMFLEPPQALVVARGAGRLRPHELLERMRISGTPKTVVVDAKGFVRDVVAGIASPAVCDDYHGKGEG